MDSGKAVDSVVRALRDHCDLPCQIGLPSGDSSPMSEMERQRERIHERPRRHGYGPFPYWEQRSDAERRQAQSAVVAILLVLFAIGLVVG
jgi:hypothetical protein